MEGEWRYVLRRLADFCTNCGVLDAVLWELADGMNWFSLESACACVKVELAPKIAAYDAAVRAQCELRAWAARTENDPSKMRHLHVLSERARKAQCLLHHEMAHVLDAAGALVLPELYAGYALRSRVLMYDCSRVGAHAESVIQLVWVQIALGAHARAGRGSALYGFDDDVLRMIYTICRVWRKGADRPPPTTMWHLA